MVLSSRPAFNDLVGAVLGLSALGVVGYLAVVLQSEQAAGAVIALLSAAAGWVYRGKIQQPGEPPVDRSLR